MEAERMFYEVGNSRVKVTEKGIEITIEKEGLGKKRWEIIVGIIKMIIEGGLSWILKPSQIERGKTGKRWKNKGIDSLSCLMYGLVIPRENKLKKLYEAIKWEKIDEICGEGYKNEKRGAPAYAPQKIYRILVLMFVSGTPFERETLRRLETDLSWRWFVGLSIWCKVPDGGTLSKFRKRIGVERFERILVEIVKECDEAGLIGHEESYYDMTGVEASATALSAYQRAVILVKAMSKYLEGEGEKEGISKEEIGEIVLEVLSEKHSSLKKVKVEQLLDSQEVLEKKLQTKSGRERNWWRRLKEKWVSLKEKWSGNSEEKREQIRAIARKLAAELPQTFGNPDAKVGRMKSNEPLCGYRSGFLVDAKKRIITAVIFGAVTIHEAPTVLEALNKHYAIFEHYPPRLGLDAAFDDDNIHRQMKLWGIDCITGVRPRHAPKGVFGVEKFLWNEQKQLICPNGRQMLLCSELYKDGSERYRVRGDCSDCPLIKACLTVKVQTKKLPQRQLTIKTLAHQRAQEHRQRSYSPQGQALRHRRFASEGLFGHLNRYHNGDKAPYRSSTMDLIAQLMVAGVANLEQLAFRSSA